MTGERDVASQQREGSQNRKVQRAISQLLRESSHQELRRINVVVDSDRVTLSGTVSSYYLKQIAQETTRQACCERKVYNNLDVLQVQA